MVKSCPSLGDGGGVAKHAHCPLHFGQISSWYNCRRLVVDADLETSWTPVNELDGTLGLDRCNGGVHIFGDDVTAIQQTARHVLALAGIAFHHLIGRLEAGVGDFRHRELLMIGSFGGNDGRVSGKGEVDARIRDKIGLEFGQIDIEGTIKAKRCGNGGDNLGNQPV